MLTSNIVGHLLRPQIHSIKNHQQMLPSSCHICMFLVYKKNKNLFYGILKLQPVKPLDEAHLLQAFQTQTVYNVRKKRA